MSYSDTVLRDSPVAYWQLGEPSGTSATDSSGNAHTGTYANVTLAQPGLVPEVTAALFNGTSSKVTIPAAAAYNFDTAQSFSVECWINSTQSTCSASGCSIVDWGVGGGVQHPFAIRLAAGGFAYVNRQDSSSNSFSMTSTVPIVNDGLWHYLVFIKSSTTLYLYIDGGANASGTDPAVSTTVSADSLYLGAQQVVRWWAGTLAEVAIYNAALSSEQVLAHWLAGASPPNPHVAMAHSKMTGWQSGW